MTDSTINVRDNVDGTSKAVATKLDSTTHYPVHVVTRAIGDDIRNAMVVTTDTASHELFSAPTASPDLSHRVYIGSVQIANDGGSASLVGIYDGAITSPDVAKSYIKVPAGDTITVVYDPPLQFTVANAVNILAATASTIYVSAQGFNAP